MKITYLSNTAIPSDVASSIQIVKMCEAFTKNGNYVNLITTNASKNKSNIFDFYSVKNKFKIFKLNYFKTFPLGFKYYLFSLFSIIKGIKLKTDIYITRNYFSCFLLVVLRKKIIMELHHGLNEESRIVQWLFKNTKFLNSKHVIKIIAITNAVKDYYAKNYSVKTNKIQVLPSGSSINKNFKFRNYKKFLKIGYFGSIYKSRGYKLIIELAKLDKKNKYFIYGNIDNKNLFRKNNINNNLYWNNYIPYKEIPKNLEKMDILIMPYVSSITTAGDVGDITNFTSPLKLFDYLRVGKIIICSDIIVLREVLKQNTNAIFVKNFKKPCSWLSEINRMSISNEKQFIISKNNYKLGQIYSLNNRAKKILENIKI